MPLPPRKRLNKNRSFHFPPCLTSTGNQAFPAIIVFEFFGGCCVWNRHKNNERDVGIPSSITEGDDNHPG